jgi:hypothetical protein
VTGEKLFRMVSLDRLHRYSPALEPPTEMFNCLNVTVDGVAGVTATVQILHKGAENYGEMPGRHPAASKRPLEVTVDHGTRRKGRALSTDCHTSSYSFPSQIEAKFHPPPISIPPN